LAIDMFRDASLHSAFSAVSLTVVTLTSLGTAWCLGPSEFGRLAAFQAIYSMLGPLVALRLDTRVATCKTKDDLVDVLDATCTSALLFMAIGSVIAVALSPFLDLRLSLMGLSLAALGCVIDAFVTGHAFLGHTRHAIVGRTMRQVVPSGLALLAVTVTPDYRAAAVGALLGMAFCLPQSLRHLQAVVRPSLTRFRRTLGQHAQGLLASMSLGLLNTVWLNGLLPAMNWLGLSQAAGQFALVQRLMGAPLGVVALGLNAMLIKAGDTWHLARERIAKLAAGLFVLAAVVALCIDWALHGQQIVPLPSHWVLDRSLYMTAAFFLCSSFAVGSLSVIGIRQRDEWFLAAWQFVAVLAWVLALIFLPSTAAFQAMLSLGGLAYWVLVWRWVVMSRRLVRAQT
jgi:hypothetical protein